VSRARGYALVASAASLWALNGAVSKVVLDHGIDSGTLTQARVTGACVGLALPLLLTRPTALRATPRQAAYLVAFGVVGLNGVQVFYFLAIHRLPLGIAVLIEYLAPVLVALYVRFVLRRPVGSRLWAAIVAVLVGLALIVDAAGGGGGLSGAGIGFALLAAASYAVYILMAEHLVGARAAESTLAWGFGAAAVFWAVLRPPWDFPYGRMADSVSLGGRLADASVPLGLLIAWIIVLGSVIPFAMMVRGLASLPATRATLLATWEPVAGAVIAWAWLGERLTADQVAGGLLVLTGILVAETAGGAVTPAGPVEQTAAPRDDRRVPS
jgi:drug/metabolite transporter (DMT)-like permease